MLRIDAPVRPAILSAPSRAVAHRDELTDATCLTLAALILLQRFAIPVGAEQVPLVTFLLPLYVAWLSWRGYLELSTSRLVLFFLSMSLVTATAGSEFGKCRVLDAVAAVSVGHLFDHRLHNPAARSCPRLPCVCRADGGAVAGGDRAVCRAICGDRIDRSVRAVAGEDRIARI